jgi:hypothetical protein
MISITKSKIFIRAIIASVLLIIYFVFNSQIWATLWILAIPIGFFVILFFVIIFIGSISFWIKKRDTYRHLYLPFSINLFAIVIILCLPSRNRSKQHYRSTGTLCNYRTGNCGCNLYAEYFNVYDQGAWGTGLNSEYLTDSVSFRKYLGVYDQGDEHIDILCKGDSIIVTKTSSEFISTQWSKPRVLERKVYSLRELRKKHDFE